LLPTYYGLVDVTANYLDMTKIIRRVAKKVKKVKGLDIYIPSLTGKPRPAAVYN